jgi:hypothetical protein
MTVYSKESLLNLPYMHQIPINMVLTSPTYFFTCHTHSMLYIMPSEHHLCIRVLACPKGYGTYGTYLVSIYG